MYKPTFCIYNVIVTPCFCVYHPWCVSMHTWIYNHCANSNCQEKFPDSWLKSFGLHGIEEPYKGSVKTESSVKKQFYLNLDIGGLNYIPKRKFAMTNYLVQLLKSPLYVLLRMTLDP
ncbi:hypothetical protein KC19_8G159600 [Ceratodon purpureus]|uniref:Uncharacterized protein n=1 Tax=Ceratodon purpureus TaxID=3225 RepID=A0A8T0H1N6_CERPU|nr:hypothetical protein KC19_8G159600 [Ceratodon purpureus]